MDNKTNLISNNIEKNISNEDIILAPPVELLDEAKEIERNTTAEEKFSFTLQYDSNQKEFLLSILQEAGAIVEAEDEKDHTFDTRMNMTQLAFVKRLDCVEKIMTNEGTNPFLMEKIKKNTSLDVEESVKQATENDVSFARSTANKITISDTIAMMAISEESEQVDSVAVASLAATTSCCPCPSNVTMATAKEISDESYTSGHISCPGSEQWFKFTATKTDYYTILTMGSLDTIGTLYDCSGNLLVEVDDYAPCGKINFRIIRSLTAGETYYIKVRLHGNSIGSYTLRVTERMFANYVTINKSIITLEKDVLYELPITPNYTYKGYNGAQPISGLSVSINPSDSHEQKVWWWEQYGGVLECFYGWDDDDDQYIHVRAKEKGSAKLYALDWDENGKRDECTVCITEGWPEYDKPTIYSRTLWGARNVVENRLIRRTKNPEAIIFHHTADKFNSTNISEIIAEIKETQNEHIDDKSKCDIAYHFIIDPAGGIWQGAEIDEYQRGHAAGHFDDIGVVLLGDFESRFANSWSPNSLNENQKTAMLSLSKWLCYEYDLPFDRVNRASPITTHKSASGGTECPGDNAEPWIENDLEKHITNWHP